MNIRQKLFLFVLFGSFIPLSLIFSISYTQQKEQLNSSVEASLSSQAAQAIKAIQDRVLEAQLSLSDFSVLSVMESVRTNDSLGLIKQDIDRFALTQPIFSEITALNAAGDYVATTDSTAHKKNIAKFKEFREAVNGNHYMSIPGFSNSTGFYVSTLSFPIKAPTGDIIGVIMGHLDWRFLKTYLSEEISAGKAFSENHVISVRSARNGVQLYKSPGEDIPFSTTKNSELNVLEDVVIGDTDFISLVVASSNSTLLNQSSLLLHIFTNKKTAFSPINTLTAMYTIIGIIAFSLVGIMWWLISKSIGDRIANLTQGARQISKGNYDYQLTPTNQSDEIGQLAQSFDIMRHTIKYNEEMLIEKTHSAEQAAKLKGEFLANMSHEVRTPINGVLGMAELMLQTDMDVNQKRYASTILRSGQSLLSVINDILDFSKIEAGKLDITKAPFDLRETVEDVAEMLAETAHRKALELNVEISPDEHVAFNGDAGRIRQVLVNLINNAIKFTATGEVNVKVSSIPNNDGAMTNIRFDISDTGIGIPADKKEQVFQDFEQADGTTTREYGGTGLGLAISKKLATLMNGAIGFTSEVGVGSNFWFTVQLESLSEEFQDRWSSSESLENRYVLIVDDHQTNRDILHDQLAHWGAQTIMANGPMHALQLIEDCRAQNRFIDVAIVDQQMPKMNGISLIQKIKETWPDNETAFVVLSSVNENRDKESARALSNYPHITKPARQKDLYNCLAAVLSNDSAIEAGVKSRKLQDLELSGSVLLVEDNPVNQEMMMEMLRLMGMTVELAENGEEAVKQLGERAFNLVFMDCQMPVMDGFAATSIIRKKEASSNSADKNVIIALTANALEGDRERCLAAGMSDYLSKPVSTAELRQCLVKWLPEDATNSSADLTEKSNSPSSVTELPQTTDIKAQEPVNIEVFLSKELPVIKQAVFQDVMKMCEQASDGFYNKLVLKYIDGSNDDLTAIQSAIADSDAELIRTSSHRLKSSSANWGGERVASLCQKLESAGKDNDLSNVEALFTVLQSEVDELITQLNGHQRAA